MAKSLLEQYEDWKKKKQAEVQQPQQPQQPKYTIPSTGSIAEKYESYKQQRQTEERAAYAKRVSNPYHLRNVMVASAVQNTQRKQAAAARVVKEEEEEESRRVKQEENQSWIDYVQRLRDQYMPVRPDPIPQVDINKKYGPQSELPKRGVAIASAGMSDFAQHTDNKTVVATESEKQSIDDLTAQRAEVQKDLETYDEVLKRKAETQTGPGGHGGRTGSLGPTPQVETAGQTIEELTAQRDQLLKEIETLDTVLKWPVGRLDVEGQRNFTNAQVQRPQAQKALESLNEQIRLKEKEAQTAEDDAQVEALKAKYEAAPEGEKGQVLAELKAAEYNRDWNAMAPHEKTGVWLGDRAKRAAYTINDAIYAIPDLIADVAGIERLQWSKDNKSALKDVQSNIEMQAKKTGWLVNAAGDVVSEGIRMIPTILIASMTGGASLAAQGAANIATAGAGTGAKIAQGTVAMLKNPKFVNSFFTIFGLGLSRAREAGVDPATAVSMAWQKAFSSALIEMSGGYEKAAERGRGWLDWLIGSLEEGGEEVVQGVTETAIEKTFGNVFNLSVDDVISLTNQEAIVSGARAVEEFGLGAVTAGVMGGAQIGLLKGIDAITGNDPRINEVFPDDIGRQIADNEADYAKLESDALETAARERMDFETRDGEAAKKYSEIVKLATDTLPAESATRAMIAEEGPIDTKRMEAVAKGALSEYSELLKANPSDEMAGEAQALNKAIDALYTGIKVDRDTTVDKYTAGLDEAVKSEIKGKNDVSYAKGYGVAHALGQYGVSNDTIAKVTAFEDAKKAAEEGRAKWDSELPKAKNKAAELRKTLPVPGKGSVSYHSNVKQDALTTGQRDQIGLLEQVAKPMGYKFVMVEFAKDAAGNYVTDKGKIAPNGYFRDTDGTIYIDVNAGKTAGRMVEDTIIPQTAGHELTHYLKANSPELFRAYGAAVIEELSAKGQDINALIAQKIGRAKQSSIGVEAALEEVIADSSAMMLQNTQAVQKMAETNPGLFEKITEWVKDFIDRVRKAFSKVEGTPEAKALMSMRDGVMKYADSLQKMWDDMAVSVAQTRVKEEAVVTQRDVQPVARQTVQETAREAAGKKTAYTSDGQAVDYHYEIAPVGSLIPSNLETSLEPNPDYPQELQPRDRTREASQQQVEEIAKKLNPALLGESADVGTGAPFVGPDMVVESGNGRVLAITRAMRQGKGLTYTQWLKDNAGRFGLDAAKVDNSSVLVRVRDTEVNRPEFVQKANESQVATYSDSESAAADAKKVTPAMLEMANMDSGDINSVGNGSFVASFINKVVPAAERGRMMDASGKLSKSGENRVRTALFQMAYEDGYLTEQMAEASDDTSKNILKAMTAVAPRLALMNDAMKKGTLSDYPIGQAIAEAYRIVQRQKRLGVSVDRYINQQSLVRQDTPAHWMLLEMFNENRNAPNRMADALNAILNAAERQGNPNQMLMPGLEAERPSVEGIVRDGLNKYADEAAAASERYQERDPAPAMYSKMAQEIEAYKGDKLGADSVVKYLQGGGVKADEIRWSGIVPFLQGKKSVSKAELLEFAKASALRVEDVTLESNSVKVNADESNESIVVVSNGEELANIYKVEANEDSDEYWHDSVEDQDFSDYADAMAYAKRIADDERRNLTLYDYDGERAETKFSEYALPGGTNYREALFTAPDLDGTFQSAHFDEKNVLAHTRLQDFQTPDGKPVLFVEEVQSDWHEKGREEGYAKPVNVIIGEYKSQGKEGYPDIAQVHDDNENLIGYIMPMHGKYVADAGNGRRIGAYETEKQALDALAENEKYRFGEVPEAPFATTWHEYVLKRVLRMAAEGGYDYVGWTTGQMQADRYSLARQVGAINAYQNSGERAGTYDVDVVDANGYAINGITNSKMSKAELLNMFGKDLGARLIEGADNKQGGRFQVLGEGLKVGGEGMKAFYDIGGKSSQNIPRFLNKYGAQWGAKIQTIDMQGSENTYQVPAIEVTDAMKDSVLYEGQPLYQERDPDYRTKRDILAGAFDSVAQTESEKRNLKEYKNLIGSLNRMEEEARGLRQANTAERKKPERDKTVIDTNTKRIAEIEERINNLDKRLLKMQNAAPLQNVLKREVDYYKKQQSALNKQQLEKYRADRAETAMKQRYRGDISKGVKSLNTMLVNESDQKHIPEGFKGAVVDFLRLFTDDTSVFDYKRLSVLKEMYDALETSDSELAGMYDFDTAQDIADAARMLEGKRLSQLTEAELESLRDIVAHFNHIVKNENQIFTQKRSVKTTDAAEEGLSEYGKKAKEMRLALLNGKNPIAAINKFLTSKNVKPVYFFKRVGGILQELFDDVRAAQGKWAFRMSEDRNFFRNTVNKYNYYKWVDDGQLTFTTARGDQITLTRDQALELYAINKREKTNKQQGAEHLAVGGFVYEDAVKVKKKSALGVPMTYEVNVGENHPLTDSDLDQIGKWLTNEQRAFADEMVNYLSTVMGERGNEVSLAMYGIRKYIEKYYFPYKSASNYLYSHQGGVQDDSAIKHRSFTKRTTVSANNPVVLTGFTKVWADHVQNMNLYNAMAVPLDNFNRVYNYRIRGDKDATKAQSVKAALETAYGKEANAYIKQLLNDVNGGIRPDKGDAEARKMMSLWKKGAVFASLSVVVQQPSAIGRALALVDPKYFRKGYTKAGYEEMMKWSGTANIKAMGRFDANMGMTAAGWLTQREYTGMDEKAKAFAKDGSFRDDVLSWLPQKADEMTWTALWEAVKRETASKHGNLIGSDAFMQKVAERFDEVVDYTQVYDSVLSRSEVMRSQTGLAQMITAFMAEPTTAYNMLLDSVVNAKNKGMKNYVKPGRALGAFAVSVLLNSILKSMVTAGRDDDEKYTYLEKYLRKLSGSIVDELNPLGLVPYGRDILSLWEGYDVERADMSLIGGLLDAAKKMGKADMPLMQKADTLAGAIGNALGVPYKNVRRDIQGIYNVLASSAPLATQSASGAKYSLLEGLPWFDASRAGYARKLYSAITNGDAQEEAGLREQMSKIVKKDSDINTELRKIITTEFEEERLEPRIALQQMIDLTELKEIKGKIGNWYKDGLIGQDVAEQLLVEFTQDDQPNERYKTIEGWNYSKNPDNEGESYSTYKAFYEAIDSGKDLRAVVSTYMDPNKYGATKSTLSGRITDNYKEQYIEAYKRSRTEAAALKARLLNAYVLLGYDRDKKSKDIDAWLK